MKTFLLLTLLAVSKASTPAAPPAPLRLSLYQSVGMAPLTLRVKVTAAAEGKEVCLVVDGPEYRRACRTLDGITWTQDILLRVGGTYAVFAVSDNYRTAELPVRVIGLNDPEGSR